MIKSLALALLLVLPPHLAEGYSSPGTTDFRTVDLMSVGPSQLAVLDGGEWASVQVALKEEKLLPKSTRNGYMTIITGRNGENQRVVGMQCPGSRNSVYEDSVAVIPRKVSEEDAIATYIVSLSSVHTTLPKAEQVGGSADSVIAGKAVVLGSSELACFAGEALAAMGIDVSLVSPGSPKVKKSVGKIDVLKPAVGPENLGFSSFIGNFDSLLDTVSNERPVNNLLNPELDGDDELSLGSTLRLLKSRHSCQKYVSTLTHCQSIISREGIFGGPGQAEKYSQKAEQSAFLDGPDCQPIPPLRDVGNTIQTILEKGVVFSAKQRKKMHQKSESVRGWSLADFWEQSTWPQDASSVSAVRFGLPAIEEKDIDLDSLISEIPTTRQSKLSEEEDSQLPEPVRENPYVEPIVGVSGLKSDIEDAGLDCILFLSAKFCKTCKTINPRFTRMAQQAQDSSPVVYAKAEASGRYGKELGKALEVDAVPAFVLFRKGKMFGSPLSASKLPSRKITRALHLLESGAQWDPDILKEEQ